MMSELVVSLTPLAIAAASQLVQVLVMVALDAHPAGHRPLYQCPLRKKMAAKVQPTLGQASNIALLVLTVLASATSRRPWLSPDRALTWM